MAKISESTLLSAAPQVRKYTSLMERTVSIFILLIICLFLINHTPTLPSWTTRDHKPNPKPQEGTIFDTDWDAITPSEKLRWVPCYSRIPLGLLCARLTVPMDYNRPLRTSSANPKVHIALIMLPGKGHSLRDPASSFSVSPLIINPGGPGGSGVQAVLSAGQKLSTMVSLDRDVVSFDPRGVGFTWPLADCFLDDYAVDNPPNPSERSAALLHRLTYVLQVAEIGLANSSDKSLGQYVTRIKGLTKLCEKKDGTDSILRHIGTPNVARDLLSIVEAWDLWMDERAKTRPPRNDGADSLAATVRPSEDPRLDTRGKLVYWGFSYGTVLGGTFASMFPAKVGRMVLDGVVSLDIYRKNEIAAFITDADAVFESFFRYCYEAREKCFFYRPGQEPKDLKQRYNSIMSKLEKEPLIVTSSEVRMPIVVRASDIHTVVFRWLSVPMTAFPVLALLLDFIELELDPARLVIPPDLSPVCSAKFLPVQQPNDANLGIICSDLRFNWNESLANLQESFEKLAETSKFADYWALQMAGCTGWRINPIDPPGFNLNITIPQDGGPAIKTAFPILFVSNTFDPVTPMHNGLAMSRRFVDAGFLEQRSEGHCSIATVSLCTMGKIKAYLEDGIVPPPPIFSKDSGIIKATPKGVWDRCKADENPWRPFGGTHHNSMRLNLHDMRFVKAWRETHDSIRFGMSTLGPRRDSGPLQNLLDMSLDDLEDKLTQLVTKSGKPKRG
ncbi:uncharacterized protein PgNI_03408 [Pyricularia grisea]|uniref:Peptidase S33 tripeptidyl aminopeptidase-like C-terminal domain-containing protein n=1 Tax=Pyricularia grisea TaxID=148305 RepID=A0A6P8BD14_PYRGI|nr:uncharacterized protein PgNI_03408 [Pyricularia grisea]TLD13649.1 hypothetical protein PgNI_03408 [Pyricularia grisea]